MFVTLGQYFLHTLLISLSVFIADGMYWITGFSFCTALVDMVLSSCNLMAVWWYMLVLQGQVFFIVYYLVLRLTIKRFNLFARGHELHMARDEADSHDVNIDATGDGKRDKTQILALQYISAIGGSDNLTSIDACVIRHARTHDG